MITAISASLGGDGDIAEKMNAMISSISMALNSMSFAFLTSILGVSISVLLLVSLNFFNFFYQKENNKVREKSSKNHSSDLKIIQERLDTLTAVNIDIAQKMLVTTESNQLATEISAHLLTLSTVSQENLVVLQSIKETNNDWKIKLADYLLKEKEDRKTENNKISEEVLKIGRTTQWLKEKMTENRKKLLTLLSME
ncbi:hypothetical protein ABN063_17520 [Providencia vermicola]|uniref:hypothetical protein n=1 Tax=Providencia vermicola TaxID=333965 RepID=UPI0032DA6E29